MKTFIFVLQGLDTEVGQVGLSLPWILLKCILIVLEFFPPISKSRLYVRTIFFSKRKPIIVWSNNMISSVNKIPQNYQPTSLLIVLELSPQISKSRLTYVLFSVPNVNQSLRDPIISKHDIISEQNKFPTYDNIYR